MVRSLLKQVLGPLTSRLEDLVVVRLSVLLGWMLPYSAILRRLCDGLRVLWDAARQANASIVWCVSSFVSMASAAMGPGLSVLVQPFFGAASAGRALWEALATTVRGASWAVTSFGGAFASPGSPTGISLSPTRLLQAEFTLSRQAFMSIYNCTCFLGAKVAKHQASMRLAFARWRVSMKHRLVKVARRYPVSVAVVLFAFTWRFRPPGVMPGAGRSTMWGPDGVAATWLRRLQAETSHLEPEMLSVNFWGPFACGTHAPGTGEAVLELWRSGRIATPSAGSSQWLRLVNHRSWWWWAWDYAIAPSVCPRILPARMGDSAMQIAPASRVGLKRTPQRRPAVKVNAVELLCRSELHPLPCWSRLQGGRRCSCPLQFVQGFNVTLQEPGQVALIVPQRQDDGNATAFRLPCSAFEKLAEDHSSRHQAFRRSSCIAPFTDVMRAALTPGTSMELWGVAMHGSRSALASFVLEAPNLRVNQPWAVSLCREDDVAGQWKALLRPCRRSLGSGRKNKTGQIRARWHQSDLAGCIQPRWRVWLNLHGSSQTEPLCGISSATKSIADRGSMSCAGFAPTWAVHPSTGVHATVELTCQGTAASGQSKRYSLAFQQTGSTGLHALSPLLHAGSPSPVLLRSPWPLVASLFVSLLLVALAASIERVATGAASFEN